MKWIDTHSHLYLKEFEHDKEFVMKSCISSEVFKVLLPNIDNSSIKSLYSMKDEYFAQVDLMMGLHPCSVNSDFKKELDQIYSELKKFPFCGIGEIGLDLYWDKTFFSEQLQAFKTQLMWAKEMGLPVSIHSREATDEALQVIEDMGGGVKGVFHCFSGSVENARSVVDFGMYLGIGGVVTYKNTNLPEVIKSIGLESIVLETDSPYLSPIPFRGKRNESGYIPIIGTKVAEIMSCTLSEVAEITTRNALRIFYSKGTQHNG